MDLQKLKQQVFNANLDIVKHGLVIFTWGNVSGIDRDRGLVVIKPSGISYDEMKIDDMVVLDMSGKVVPDSYREGNLKPSSDTATHILLYNEFPEIGGVVHTHSTYATAWCQAGKSIPVIGTTHADYFSSDIPCTDDLTKEAVESEYEKETGRSIIKTFEGLDPMHIPAVLVKNHGPFTWGKSPDDAVNNSVVLEQIAKLAQLSYSINPGLSMNKELVKKHFDRKHGANAYYGQ